MWPAFGRGVYRSRDGGQSWEARNNGLPAHEPLAWRLAQDRNGVLYVVLARRSEDGSIGNDGDGALYRSKNAGESWEKVPLPAGVNGPNGLAIDPEDPEPAVPGGVAPPHGGPRGWRRYLPFHRRRRDVETGAGARPARLRRDHRSARQNDAVRLRLRVLRLALHRPRPDAGSASAATTSNGATA